MLEFFIWTFHLDFPTWAVSSDVVDEEEEDPEDGGLDGFRNDLDQRDEQDGEPRFGWKKLSRLFIDVIILFFSITFQLIAVFIKA